MNDKVNNGMKKIMNDKWSGFYILSGIQIVNLLSHAEGWAVIDFAKFDDVSLEKLEKCKQEYTKLHKETASTKITEREVNMIRRSRLKKRLHSSKKIVCHKHQKIKSPFLLSRTEKQQENSIWVWER